MPSLLNIVANIRCITARCGSMNTPLNTVSATGTGISLLAPTTILRLQRRIDMGKTERVYIRLTPELKAQLQTAAEAESRSITKFVEHLIKQALKKEGQ